MTQVDTRVREVPAIRPEVSGAWALGTGVSWLVGYQAMLALEPAAPAPMRFPGSSSPRWP